MIIVIQCAARKKPDAGHFRAKTGRPILFVADPVLAPADRVFVYARPDDLSDSGETWRAQLLAYNKNPGSNPLGLLPAWQLYENRTYESLVDRYGVDRVYILSAGWGLIAGDFLTPAYDITFSPSAERYKRRQKRDDYDDLCMLPRNTTEPIVFFGGKDYVPLFSRLTAGAKEPRYFFYNASREPIVPGCLPIRFETATRTNWQYECANAVIAGRLSLDTLADTTRPSN